MIESSVLDRVRCLPLVAGMAESTLERLAAAGALVQAARGTALFGEGEPARAVHLLLSGRVASTATGNGRHSTVITLLGEGDLVAVPPLLLGCPSRVGAVATSASEVLAIDAEALRAVLAADSAFERAVLDMLAGHWCALIE